MSSPASDPRSRKTPEPDYTWGESSVPLPETAWEHAARPLWAQVVPDAAAVFLMEKQRLLCRSLVDGALRWEQPCDAMPEELAVDGTAAAVAVGQDLRLLELAGGTPRWSKRMGGNVNGLLLERNTLYVAAIQRSRGVVFALERDTGEVRWRTGADAEVEIHPVGASNLLVLDDPDTERLRAFDSRTGEQRWEFSAEGEPTVVGPLAAGTLLVSAHGAGAVGLDAQTGTVRWRLEGGGPFEAAAELRDDRAYLTNGSAYALDPATGELFWSREPADDTDGVFSLRMVGDTLLAETWRGRLLSLDPATGALRWEISPGQVQAATGDAERLYLRLNHPQKAGAGAAADHWSIAALERATGKLCWQLRARHQVAEITHLDGHLVAELKNHVLVLRTSL